MSVQYEFPRQYCTNFIFPCKECRFYRLRYYFSLTYTSACVLIYRMDTTVHNEILEVIPHFAIYGDFVSCKPMGNGHINSTYCSVFNQAGTQVRYTHQRINKNVFKNPPQVMDNIKSVTDFLRKYFKNAGLDDVSRRTLTVVPCWDGKLYYQDAAGEYWRTYLLVENVKTYEVLENEDLARQLGQIIGAFQNQLATYDGPRLADTIPRFHDMGMRYEQLEEALSKDVKNRAAGIKDELDFLFANKERGMILVEGLKSKKLKEGITHNDTKINNILFDEKTSSPLCVIDLDTVMPGTVLFDTGDLIRTATNTAEEDEKDTSKVQFNFPLFKALIEGYYSEAKGFLSDYEKSLLAESGRNITQIMAVRMITDYLNGDVYYHIDYPEHNIVRARTQIALIKSMDEQWDKVKAFIDGLGK